MHGFSRPHGYRRRATKATAIGDAAGAGAPQKGKTKPRNHGPKEEPKEEEEEQVELLLEPKVHPPSTPFSLRRFNRLRFLSLGAHFLFLFLNTCYFIACVLVVCACVLPV